MIAEVPDVRGQADRAEPLLLRDDDFLGQPSKLSVRPRRCRDDWHADALGLEAESLLVRPVIAVVRLIERGCGAVQLDRLVEATVVGVRPEMRRAAVSGDITRRD